MEKSAKTGNSKSSIIKKQKIMNHKDKDNPSKIKTGQPVTVLQIRNSIAYGGVETTMLGWLDHIDTSRFSCPVAIFMNRDNTQDAFVKPLIKHNQEVLEVPWAPNRNVKAAVKRIVDIIHERDVKLIHSHDWRSDFIGYLAARKTGVPIMTTIYVWFRRPFLTKIKEWLDAMIIRKFDMVTAVCEATREQTVARGIKREKTDVLISGISPDLAPGEIDRRAIREGFGIGEDDTAFVFVARFYGEKAHDTLLRAFAAARATGQSMKLLLLGTGPLEEKIRNLAQELSISEHVIMPGFIDNVPSVLKAMDVMVHASLAEGISLAIYEGMLCGLPVIGSDVDGTPEVVIPGRTGWLVPVRDEEALCRALLDAGANPDLRRKMGKEAHDFITANYNMDKAIGRLEATYTKLIENT